MGNMLRVVSDREKLPDSLVSAGAVVEMRFGVANKGVSLRAAKLMHLAVKAAGPRLTEHIKHSMPLSEIADTDHMAASKAKEIAEELIRTPVNIVLEKPRKLVVSAVLDFVEIDDEGESDSRIVFRFGEAMCRLFAYDDRWALLSKAEVLAYSSRYSLRLFEILSLRRDRTVGEEEFSVADLRARLGVEKGKLTTFSNFRLKALDVAVEEVSRNSDIQVTYVPVKTGRAVSGVRLSWTVRTAPATISGPQGRPLEEGFPSGTIAFSSPWREIARTHGGGWDIDRIAVEFRNTGIPLKGPKVQAAFKGFCQNWVGRRGPAR